MPLYNSCQLSDKEHNDEFCQGFHPDNREILTNRLFAKNPNHPSDKAYNLKDILDAVQTYFSNVRLHHNQQCCLHDKNNLKCSNPNSSGYQRNREVHDFDHDCDYEHDCGHGYKCGYD